MEYDLDYKLSVKENTDTKSKYSWYINEIDNNGNVIKGLINKCIPWDGKTYFFTEKIKYVSRQILQSKKKYNTYRKVNERIDKYHSEDLDYITGILVPNKHSSPPRYSMFGTNRIIKEFNLRISVDENDPMREYSFIFGSPKNNSTLFSEFTKFDFFGDNTENNDMIQINIILEKNKFKKLVNLIMNNSLTSLPISVSNVDGFYSNLNEVGSPSHIKVLPDYPDLLPKVYKKEPTDYGQIIPRLGEIGEVDILTNVEKVLMENTKKKI